VIYRDPFITKLISVFNAEGSPELKNRYFYGDPLQVPKNQLPACFITRDSTRVTTNTNGEIQTEADIVINAVFDLTRDFNQAFDNITSSNTMYDCFEGRNADYTLKDTSLVYILDKHQSLDTNLWINLNAPIEPDYGVSIEKRGPGIYTVEGVIRITLTHHQLRPGA
jgi:hypothetical protein